MKTIRICAYIWCTCKYSQACRKYREKRVLDLPPPPIHFNAARLSHRNVVNVVSWRVVVVALITRIVSSATAATAAVTARPYSCGCHTFIA